jgi:hypothetical protein
MEGRQTPTRYRQPESSVEVSVSSNIHLALKLLASGSTAWKNQESTSLHSTPPLIRRDMPSARLINRWIANISQIRRQNAGFVAPHPELWEMTT